MAKNKRPPLRGPKEDQEPWVEELQRVDHGFELLSQRGLGIAFAKLHYRRQGCKVVQSGHGHIAPGRHHTGQALTKRQIRSMRLCRLVGS